MARLLAPTLFAARCLCAVFVAVVIVSHFILQMCSDYKKSAYRLHFMNCVYGENFQSFCIFWLSFTRWRWLNVSFAIHFRPERWVLFLHPRHTSSEWKEMKAVSAIYFGFWMSNSNKRFYGRQPNRKSIIYWVVWVSCGPFFSAVELKVLIRF